MRLLCFFLPLTAEQMFCSKCGSSISPGSAFCNKCGTPVATRPPTTQTTPTTRRAEKAEKHEKHEKGEKGEKQEKSGGPLGGALVGGSVLIWLGITFYFQTIGVLSSNNSWAYFLLGMGVILMADGVVAAMQKRPAFIGLLIGGAAIALIGAGNILSSWQNLWPLFLILVGIAVIVGGFTARRRSPTP
jgi:hypothetical protein